MTDFNDISKHYTTSSLVQKSAGQMLIDLLNIQSHEAILDVGCGPGHITKQLKDLTSGTVIGIDPSEGMIAEADNAFGKYGISYKAASAENLSFQNEFDVVFCNSAFQWFKKPDVVIRNFHHALKKAGRVGMQAPATSVCCPVVDTAVAFAREDEQLGKAFLSFLSPWFFLESSEEYKELFEKGGFNVTTHRIDEVHHSYIPDDVVNVFNSGAAAGFINQDFFSVKLPENFSEKFLERVKESFVNQADGNGMIDLVFFRVYIIAHKIDKPLTRTSPTSLN